jgi:hypothetical protein
MKGLKRSFLGGESLLITTYTAPVAGGWVDVAHHLAGDIIAAGVSAAEPMSITKGCWLASAVGVDLDTQWGGRRLHPTVPVDTTGRRYPGRWCEPRPGRHWHHWPAARNVAICMTQVPFCVPPAL